MSGPIAIVIGLITALSSAYGGLGGVLQRIGKVFSDTWDNVKEWAGMIGLSDSIEKFKSALGRLWDYIKKLYDILGLLKPVWEVVFTAMSGVATVVLDVLVGAFTGLIDIITAVVDIVNNGIEMIVGFFTFDLVKVGDAAEAI